MQSGNVRYIEYKKTSPLLKIGKEVSMKLGIEKKAGEESV